VHSERPELFKRQRAQVADLRGGGVQRGGARAAATRAGGGGAASQDLLLLLLLLFFIYVKSFSSVVFCKSRIGRINVRADDASGRWATGNAFGHTKKKDRSGQNGEKKKR
jgi:hypothetical protein